MSQDDFNDLDELDELSEVEDEQPLEDLLEGQDPDQEEPIVEQPETRPGLSWNPAGAGFRAEMDTDEQVFFVDGKKVMASEMTAEATDPDSRNWLLALQKKKLEPDENGPIPIGGSYRAPAPDELQQVLEDELVCPVCGEVFTPEDCDFHDLGQLVSYGGIVYHWACISLWMLVICRGHPEKAAEIFHIPLADMRAIKTSYRAIPWGLLGFRQPGTQEVCQ